MSNILLINGPNLNLLGIREPEIYGHASLKEIESQLVTAAHAADHSLSTFQSNAEHALIERVHTAMTQNIQIILINPGAYTHTSIALRDALLAVNIPFINLHLSEPLKRESFRHHSYLNDIAVGTISGFGIQSYDLALSAAIRILEKEA